MRRRVRSSHAGVVDRTETHATIHNWHASVRETGLMHHPKTSAGCRGRGHPLMIVRRQLPLLMLLIRKVPQAGATAAAQLTGRLSHTVARSLHGGLSHINAHLHELCVDHLLRDAVHTDDVVLEVVRPLSHWAPCDLPLWTEVTCTTMPLADCSDLRICGT